MSFFKSLAGDKLMTSVAQVFDERGDGLIVQGGSASYDKDDRSPHLSREDAQELLAQGLATYRREHKTMPARLVRPTVGLIATLPLTLAGQTRLPLVSVPSATAARLAETDAPEPELEPQAL